MTKKPIPRKGKKKSPIRKPLPRTRRPDPKRPLGPEHPKKGDSPTKE